MDYIFLECLPVLKVKGRGSKETVNCLGHLEIQFVDEHRELRGLGSGRAPSQERVMIGSAQRGTVLFKSESHL